MRTPDGLRLRERVPLAGATTLGIGGPARWLIDVDDADAAAHAVELARTLDDRAPLILGSGSNVLVADGGYPGVVLRFAPGGRLAASDDGATLVADAGVEWESVVAFAVARGLQGIECLSGIPGRVGAAPVQNIGAYGQEVGEVVQDVRLVDLTTASVRDESAAALGFGYRTSVLKREPGRFVVTRVRLRLRRDRPPVTGYRDVALRLAGVPSPSLAHVRDIVLAVRRDKSMLIDVADPNHRSAGSFFMNPVVAPELAAALAATHPAMPAYPAPNGVKLSAAWLIEHAGLPRGTRHGAVGLSTRHVLALVNVDGSATSDDVVAFAAFVRNRVLAAFGVGLEPEPVFIGFAHDALTLMDALL